MQERIEANEPASKTTRSTIGSIFVP